VSSRSHVLKVLTLADWTRFQAEGVYPGSAADQADGFIHFSTAAQIAATLAKHYAGQTDLVLLAVDLTQVLPAAVRWEPARGGDLFPHLYAPLPLAAVLAHGPITQGPNGTHHCPPEVVAWA
jgi:uncharacterized protein (DUF952 family)